MKDQGLCGSCWAFAAIGSMEGAIYRKTGKLVSLSEQNLVDCDPRSLGCNGGLERYAYELAKEQGVNTENDYPYEVKQTSCRFNASKKVFSLSDYREIATGDEMELTNYIATNGPVSAGIDAGQRTFQHYGSGIYYDPKCKKGTLNHSVLVVGYGSDKDGDYYIVKNI